MILTVVLEEQPPFMKDQRVNLTLYKGGKYQVLDNLEAQRPISRVKGTVVRPDDNPLIKFGGASYYFSSFYVGEKPVLACILES